MDLTIETRRHRAGQAMKECEHERANPRAAEGGGTDACRG